MMESKDARRGLSSAYGSVKMKLPKSKFLLIVSLLIAHRFDCIHHLLVFREKGRAFICISISRYVGW